MGEAPSLIALCMNATKKEILCGEDLSPHVYELPSDLFDSLLTCLPPLALQKLQEQMPFENWDDGESVDGCFRNQKKRRKLERIGYSTFDSVWRTLYESRWPCLARQNQAVDWLAKQNVEEQKLTNDWQQMYWEAHLQCCLDAAAEIALLPSFDGRIGEVRIPDAILKHIGYEGHMSCSRCEYSKLSYHCQQFGCYASGGWKGGWGMGFTGPGGVVVVVVVVVRFSVVVGGGGWVSRIFVSWHHVAFMWRLFVIFCD
ncbi:hypothetical protein Acr_28g0008770 [Actinidia rufa]|uniref:Uncharacterized protein n=1 Tax=Actinidia rufa TaxID=165716 RepID=A0A7J0HAN6_9ERIC|nr:hypothetical protein Acr_28g0008770 [Actinidia rufa]